MAVVEAAGDTVSLMPSSREGNSSTLRWTSDRLSKHSSCRPHRRSRSSFVHRSSTRWKDARRSCQLWRQSAVPGVFVRSTRPKRS